VSELPSSVTPIRPAIEFSDKEAFRRFQEAALAAVRLMP